MTGGKYLAEERGAFDLAEAPAIEARPEIQARVATAPLFEFAAAHDGQPPGAWLAMFYGAVRESLI